MIVRTMSQQPAWVASLCLRHRVLEHLGCMVLSRLAAVGPEGAEQARVCSGRQCLPGGVQTRLSWSARHQPRTWPLQLAWLGRLERRWASARLRSAAWSGGSPGGSVPVLAGGVLDHRGPLLVWSSRSLRPRPLLGVGSHHEAVSLGRRIAVRAERGLLAGSAPAIAEYRSISTGPKPEDSAE